MPSVLVIDDDPGIRAFVRSILQNEGFEVAEAENGLVGFDLYCTHPSDVVLTDIFMPEGDGMETIRNLCHADPDVRIVAMSGAIYEGAVKFLDFAGKLGAKRTLRKPFRQAQLVETLRGVLADA